MSIHDIDRNPEHLYPAFRELLQQALANTARATGKQWVIGEGLRTVERQLWLYASSRTRPGPWLTGMRYPTNHGAGTAADCYPAQLNGQPDYQAPHRDFVKFRVEYTALGLVDPAWAKGDYGHVQLNATIATLSQARQWVRSGLLGGLKPPSSIADPEIQVTVNGLPIADAHGFLQDGHCYLWVRSILEEIGAVITSVQGATAHIVRNLQDTPSLEDDRDPASAEADLPLLLRLVDDQRRGFIAATALRTLDCSVDFQASTKTVRITT